MGKKKIHNSSAPHLFMGMGSDVRPSLKSATAQPKSKQPKLKIAQTKSETAHPKPKTPHSLHVQSSVSETLEAKTTPATAINLEKAVDLEKLASNKKTASSERSSYKSHNSRAHHPANKCMVGEKKKPSHTLVGSAASTYRSGGREEVRRISPSASSPTVLWRTLLTGDSRLRGKRFNPFWIAETDPRNFLS